MTEGRGDVALERRLIFSNLIRGVPMPEIMKAFQMSEKEVMDVFAFVSKKIRSYRFERAMPAVRCDTVRAAMQNVPTLLVMVEAKGVTGKYLINLGSDPKYPNISDYILDPAVPMSDGERRLKEMHDRIAMEKTNGQ